MEMKPKFILYLQNYLNEKKLADSKYSLNKLSKQIGLNPGITHALLSGERKLTVDLARKIGKRIGLSGDQVREMCVDLIYADHVQAAPRAGELPMIMLMAAVRWINAQTGSFSARELGEALDLSIQETEVMIENLIDKELIEAEGKKFLRVHSSKSVVWKYSKSDREEIIRQIFQFVDTHVKKGNSDSYSVTNLAFLASKEAIEKNKILIASKMNEIANILSEDSNEEGEKEVYFLFNQVVPAKRPK